MMNLDGFELAPMADGGELTLYRGSRGRDGLPVIVAMPAADQPVSATLVRMRRSYELRDALDSSWACTPIELIQTKGRLALAMADPGGVRLEGLLGAPLDIDSFLRMAAGVAAAVARFHGKGFIHRDIKPGTLMIDPESGHAWLSGFGLTLRHPRQRPSPEPVETLAGTLAYMAPEQTGRMNRSVDARSDLYALGVIFYEMLTGELPFVATDPMELMHLHIARKPAPPQDRRADIPAVVSAIVMKLLAKASEGRYQTATGLERDLRRCLASRSEGVVASFALGEHDDVGSLLRPETLYGREHEVQTLVACFERACRGGQPEIVMVSGYSGIGKSSVVHELHKALVPPRGLFAAGKFDQYTRDVPYATLVQALDSLVKQLLVKSEADLRPWRQDLISALGGHGGAIVRLVPELEQILGPQARDPEIPPRDAQLLFQTLVKRVFAVFARRDHPLVLFFDDLQWIDTATLELLEVLCTDPAPVSLLVVGAYRDNEVDPSHPVARMLDRLRLGSVPLCEVHLGPISFDDTSRLLADGLRCDVARVEPLSSLVCDKTGRNPFFTLQFFWALEEDGFLWIDPELREWQWDLERIASKGFTDNVVVLMLARIDRLPAPSRSALRRLACLGNRASADVLCAAFDVSAEGLQDIFAEAVRAGLVATMKGGYAFVHDRVQEAAYASLPVIQRRETHLALGRLLLARADRGNLGNQVFDVVDQFNRCRELVTEASERALLVRLNLTAALRARSATSFASALAYFVAAHDWSAADLSTTDPDLAFDIAFGRAECEFLTGRVLEAEEQFIALAARTSSLPSLAAITCVRVPLNIGLLRYERALEIGLEYLARTGIVWTLRPSAEEVTQEIERTRARIGDQPIDGFLHLPVMTDPTSCGTIAVLSTMQIGALFADVMLYALLTARGVRFSLDHGNTDGSALAYAAFGALLAGNFGEYREAFRFGQLAVDLVDKRGMAQFRAQVFEYMGTLIEHWTTGLTAARAMLQRSLEAAHDTGDFPSICFASFSLFENRIAAGEPLTELQPDIEAHLAFVQRMQFKSQEFTMLDTTNTVRALRGQPERWEPYADPEVRAQHFADPLNAMATCWYWIHRIQLGFFADDPVSALEAIPRAEPLLYTSLSFIFFVEFTFYSAMAHALRHDQVDTGARASHRDAIAGYAVPLASWANRTREAFGPRADLVAAELARIEGRAWHALRLYERAIKEAREQNAICLEAIGFERSAALHRQEGFETTAQHYLERARYCYARWGADAKVRRMDEAHPRLRSRTSSPRATDTIEASLAELDLGMVLKLSQAVSSEIVLANLLQKLMTLVLEHAGAARALLLVPVDEHFRVEAEAKATEAGIVVQTRPSMGDVTYAETVLAYVVRTRGRVVIDDLTTSHPFAGDPILQHATGSLLAQPLVNHGKLSGVLYVDNHLAPRVFTEARVAVLELLAGQAASSLENARLYADLERTRSYMTEAERLGSTGSFGWDATTGDLDWSDEVSRILGHEPTAAKTFAGVDARLHPEERDALRARIARHVQAKEDFEIATRLRMPDGAVKYVDVLAHAVVTGERSLKAYVGAIKDVTASKLSADALAQTQNALAHVTRVATLGEMTTSITHEINQPLAGIQLNAAACVRWLNAPVPNVAEAREAAQRASRDASRASSVVARLRALFKRAGAESCPVDINDAIDDVLTLLRPELRRNACVLRTGLGPSLPPALGDRVQLQQVVMNLVLNGAESMKDIEDRPHDLLVRTSLDAEGRVRVQVKDAGTGIDAASASSTRSTPPRAEGWGSVCPSAARSSRTTPAASGRPRTMATAPRFISSSRRPGKRRRSRAKSVGGAARHAPDLYEGIMVERAKWGHGATLDGTAASVRGPTCPSLARACARIRHQHSNAR